MKIDTWMIICLCSSSIGACAQPQEPGGTMAETLDSGISKGDGDDTGGETGCEPGEPYCDCDAGTCDPGLECLGGAVCVPEQCPSGTLGCDCINSSACNQGLECVEGICIEPGECSLPYESCYDFENGVTTDPCCEGTLCLLVDVDEISGCTEPCVAHSECATSCCTNADIGGVLEPYCAPSASYCIDYGLCIDTCPFAEDGECDDGGPDSSYDLCELGTDCADCGVRNW